jgi:proteasome beta subunit
VLEGRYKNGLDREAAMALAADAIAAASERDTASGNGVTLATIGSEGVEITTEAVTAEVL